jgi:molybdopterin molybdotransferase
MPEFLRLVSPDEARSRFVAAIRHRVGSERVATAEATGRTLAKALLATEPLPAFERSTVDGYAVRAGDTHGASDSLPIYLRLAGEVGMGAAAERRLAPGECMLIHTGGMLPPGADAVLMLEHSQTIGEEEVEARRAVAAGENVLMTGEDVQPGQAALPAGHLLGPEDVGGLMALGILEVEAARRPVVGILATGDEVLPPERRPGPGQVRDVNSYALGALVAEAGGEARRGGIAPDDLEALTAAGRDLLAESDMLVITAGSSASARDLTREAIARLGPPGPLVHGVNVRPGKPTLLGVCGGKPALGLPGNPVSALVVARLFLLPALDTLMGRAGRPAAQLPARLTLNLASQAGREDWVPVTLRRDGEEWLAEPIFSKSNLIFSLVRADGLVRIPPDATGLGAGERATVHLL